MEQMERDNRVVALDRAVGLADDGHIKVGEIVAKAREFYSFLDGDKETEGESDR